MNCRRVLKLRESNPGLKVFPVNLCTIRVGSVSSLQCPHLPPAMRLYNLTVARPSGAHLAVFGSFSAPKAQEVVLAKGAYLTLMRSTTTEAFVAVGSSHTFSTIRSITPFRLTGAWLAAAFCWGLLRVSGVCLAGCSAATASASE